MSGRGEEGEEEGEEEEEDPTARPGPMAERSKIDNLGTCMRGLCRDPKSEITTTGRTGRR